MQGYLAGVSEGTRVLLILSVILFAGFIMTRLTNTLNLPKVSGYIMAGILIGPCGLNLIPVEIIGHMGFVSDLALAFIAFGVGKFFKKEVLLKTGSRIIIITLFEALLAGVLVTLFCVGVFKMEWNFALILGAIATATAPASTMMTINQYKAKGEFTGQKQGQQADSGYCHASGDLWYLRVSRYFAAAVLHDLRRVVYQSYQR